MCSKIEIFLLLAMAGSAAGVKTDPMAFVFVGACLAMILAVLYYKSLADRGQKAGMWAQGVSLLVMFVGGVASPLLVTSDKFDWLLAWARPPAESTMLLLAIHWSVVGFLGSIVLGGALEGGLMRLYRRAREGGAAFANTAGDFARLPKVETAVGGPAVEQLTPEERAALEAYRQRLQRRATGRLEQGDTAQADSGQKTQPLTNTPPDA